ncbi:hypothetical protein [Streptosporangium sp. 'caverna']|uniref:hypothetical protein n=1 Tax=Streptosporangium sp. 'caverna' TaxID=2202249 RepID=UPI000D7D3F73|nr:hypothetical protein [Streptosporangium sp. 'caverna']AWS45208.1 hypothetical protein DKM19_31720 [Streptosporangium sp. 'caverna']
MNGDAWRKQTTFTTAPLRSLIAIGAGVGVGLAAVGVIALSGPPNTPGSRLATAAQSVAAPAEGAYWHTRTLSRTIHPRRLGRGANRYWVEERQLTENWSSPDGKAWFGYRQLGTRPKSPADEKAWHRDGSPATWNRTAEGTVVSLSTKPDKGMVVLREGPAAFSLAGQQLSYEELQRLPAEPAGLKAWLGQAVRVAKVPDDDIDDQVTRMLPSLLHEVPVSKEIRTAAYRALSTMPGVRSLGKVKDERGRIGDGLSIVYEQTSPEKATSVDRIQMIVDTGSMMLLSRGVRITAEVNGKPLPETNMTETMLQVGWTDDEPSVPALP